MMSGLEARPTQGFASEKGGERGHLGPIPIPIPKRIVGLCNEKLVNKGLFHPLAFRELPESDRLLAYALRYQSI